MLIIPAMDIRCGQFVHVLSGPMREELIGKDDPVEIAQWWQEQGAKIIHVTDLDGAFTGNPENLETIKQIKANVPIALQVAGGIRTLEHIEKVLALGVERVVLGTIFARNPELIGQACREFEEKVIVGIEGKNNLVAIEGWKQPTDWTIIETARRLKELGVKRVLFSDTRREGSLKGPNLDVALEVAEKTGLRVILSGGVSSRTDLEKIAQFASVGIEGVIVGKALYTGNITYKETLDLIS
ncbi:MAG: 1-(5-phosphoribosyl)-5-((5-phosphoribosylamino)methylideneamino)imidazole-4-carboxamide isomerase [Clostridia bacterium]|nr:1-(5-phosphoribosyl)-5-((5-phosphoribosylamino)methylideneamino)imidazole-4-carboxamide isomerase [Clostridia bacterium]